VRYRLGRSHSDIVYRQLNNEPSDEDPRVAVFTEAVDAIAVVALLNGDPIAAVSRPVDGSTPLDSPAPRAELCGAVFPLKPGQAPCGKPKNHGTEAPDTDWKRDHHSNGMLKWRVDGADLPPAGEVVPFSVTMLGVLREPFEDWLSRRGLMMGLIPGSDQYVVVPINVPAPPRAWFDD
jgi:hypothetical protein